MKVQRAIASIIKNLGGWKPHEDADTLNEEVDDERGE
jgi:hypothetical protein